MERERGNAVYDRAVVACAVVAIALGVFFRIYALDRPLFWQDEVTTALRTTGHDAQTYGKIFDGKIHDLREIRSYVEVDRAKTPLDVAAVLAREDPQHVPLYYMLERVWIGAFGTSAVGMRGLSVLCGVVAIGLAFVLGRQLAGPRAGAIAASLVAVSPLFILMSRQAREYALFSDATLLATIAFVAALRRGGVRAWLWYALAVLAGAYTDSLFALIVVGHGCAALALAGPRSRALVAWLGATVAAYVAFVPWGIAGARVHGHVSREQAWIETTYPLKILIEKLVFVFGALAFDGEYASLRYAVFAILGIVIVAIALASNVRRSDRFARTLPLAIAIPTPLVLAAIDVVAHAHFATIPRYLIGTWVGVVVGVAVGISSGMDLRHTRAWAFACWVVLLVLGIGAAAIRGPAEAWWDNGDGIASQALARVIDSRARPLVVSEFRWNVPLELARYVRHDTRMLLFDDTVPPLALGTRDVFVIAPSPGVLAGLGVPRRFVATNVSPGGTTALQSFAKTAHAGRDEPPQDLDVGNALWLLEPR